MFNKTVDSITKVFTKAIEDLKALEDLQQRRIEDNQAKVEVLRAENGTAALERSRAKEVRTRLESIINV